ncbi:DNA primase [Streptomyces bullii]|uniref:DNA primase n=1 Tax=Streptomyces bullii TaxID=349910 RepID=A0ABW0UU67_9ACTN
MNRVGLGLAIGAGYVLGRTKKMKLAVAVGSLVAGKRMNLSPKGLADLMSQQLRNNPQFKEIGDQLREDLRGVGKAASGAMVERQLNAVADRLHGRTAQVRDQLSGVVPDKSGAQDSEDAGEPEDEEPEAEEPQGREPRDEEDQEDEEPEAARKAPSKDTAARAAEKTPAKKAAKKAPARKTAAAKKTAKKTTAGKADGRQAGKKATAASRGARAPLPKGGGER